MIIKILVFTNILVFATGKPHVATNNNVDNAATPIEFIPYQVSIHADGHHQCGGTIISENWILTAAHCLTDDTKLYTIYAGSVHPDDGTRHTVVQILKHSGYIPRYFKPVNDIALVRTNEPFVFNENCRAVELFDIGEYSRPGAASVVSGWGLKFNNRRTLRSVAVEIISTKDCDEKYRRFGGIPDGVICATQYNNGGSVCRRDAGGPVTIGGRLAGIISWDNVCGAFKYPSVFSEVASFRHWIRTHTGI